MSQERTTLNGVVEGFYGRPWNATQRRQLFSWLKAAGLNAYLYAPKDDLKQRALWREPYSAPETAELGALIRECAGTGLQFIYALSPGLDIRFVEPVERQALKAKLSQVRGLGSRHFAVLWDDIAPELAPDDARQFRSPAEAQCDVTNEVLRHVETLGGDGRLLFCPTVYCGAFAKPSVREDPYLRTVGERLAAGVDVLWTGPEIISEKIAVESLRELRGIIRRKPVLWDNLMANDYDMRRLYLGPYSGRAPELRGEIAGILLNPNCQFEANFVGIRTLGDYVRPGEPIPPAASYRRALEAWLPEFRSRSRRPFLLEDLRLMADVFHLPTKLGERGEVYLQDARALLHSPPDSWGEAQARFEQTNRDLNTLYEKATELANRDLCYALYAHLWEIKETAGLFSAWVKWRQETRNAGGRFASADFRPGIWRDGLAAALDRLLPMDAEGRFRPA